MTKYLTGFLCVFTIAVSVAQSDLYKISTIPGNLLHNADAVLRNENTTIEISSASKIKKIYHRTIAVLNEEGRDYVNAFVGYDKSRTITKLQAEIYDAFGEKIKTVKKKDFIDVSAVDGGTLYAESRVKYLDYTPINYPYTVVLRYEWQSKNTAFIPDWFPLENYSISLEKSTYTITKPASLSLRKKAKNFETYGLKEATDLTYEATNLPAVKYEVLSPSFTDIAPRLSVFCNPFMYEGIKGEVNNWKEFGYWMQQNLLAGRDVLDTSTKDEILELTAKAKSLKEKAKIVYEYLQNNTRYISVQVGIGGIQPIKAKEVDKVGYGDCKGLTNYMKALLATVGVTSYYTHVEAGANEKIDLDSDFASLAQGNHVILNIPNEGDDIWLECTSQQTPFGFLGRFTDDRNVLVITPDGGIVKRTKSYQNLDSYLKGQGEVTINTDGSLIGAYSATSGGLQYDSRESLENESLKELKSHYKNYWRYLSDLNINKIEIKNNKNTIEITESVHLNVPSFATLSGNNLLVTANVFNRQTYVPAKYLNRKLPLLVKRGYHDEDVNIITLPEGYMIENLPEPTTLESKFGTYQIDFSKIDESTIKYKRTLTTVPGNYSKEDYKSYRTFVRTIAKKDRTPIVLIKK